MFERELGEDVRCLQVDHAGLVHDDPIARAQRVPRRAGVDSVGAVVEFPRSQPGPDHRPGLVSAPSIAVLGEQSVQAGCQGANLTRCHRRRLAGGRDDQHPTPLRGECRERHAQHRRLARTGGAEGVVLAGTELGLLLEADDCPVPMHDTTALHVAACLDWMLRD